MRKIFLSIVFITALISIACAKESVNSSHYLSEQELSTIHNQLNIVNLGLQEVRRDQINYKIEKDMLKEAYSSNIQTINIVITIILGTFTVLGFIGVKSIDSIRNDFRRELDELKIIKEKYGNKFAEIDNDIKVAKEEFENIRKINKEQNNRLQLLEIQEKAATFIQNRNFQRALEYIDTGLALSGDDTILLGQKAHCLAIMGNFSEAVEINEKLFRSDQNNIIYTTNMIECYLLSRHVDKYNEAIIKYKDQIINQYPKFILWYFDIIKNYLVGNYAGMVTLINSVILDNDTDQLKRLGPNWTFDEFYVAFDKDPVSDAKTLLFKSVQFLDGNTSAQDLRASIK